MNLVSIEINVLQEIYFAHDKPVPYQLRDGNTLNILPVYVQDFAVFYHSVGILKIDKNALNKVEYIQMKYLQFLFEVMFPQDKFYIQQFINIINLCLDLKKAMINADEHGKVYIYDEEKQIKIDAKDFDEISRIIMYQNFYRYDDSYVNPDVQRAMREVDELKGKAYEEISLERKEAIIAAHTGISKKDLEEMTYRSFSMLFDEVCGEVEFTTTREIALFAGKGDEIEHWIYKKKKNKMDGYFVTTEQYAKSMGRKPTDIVQGDGSVSSKYASFTK